MNRALRHIYFLRPVDDLGPVKIGSSEVPLKRLASYQIWSPIMLEVAAYVPAHWNTEMWLHRHFIRDWLHGEWFRWSDELQGMIDYANAHGAMPDWVTPPTNPSEYKAFIEKYPRGKTKQSLRFASPTRRKAIGAAA